MKTEKTITKTINQTTYYSKVYRINDDEVDTIPITLPGKFNETAPGKYFKNSDEYRFLKLTTYVEASQTRSVPVMRFMDYARKITPADPRKPDDVTRTIKFYKTAVKVYDLKTDEIRIEVIPAKVDDVKKIKSDFYTALKVVSVDYTEDVFAVPLDTFVKISTPVDADK